MARALHAFLPPTFPAGEAGEKHQQKGALRVLLLENISLEARDSLVAAGYEVRLSSFSHVLIIRWTTLPKHSPSPS
jgi:hypothetical protein